MLFFLEPQDPERPVLLSQHCWMLVFLNCNFIVPPDQENISTTVNIMLPPFQKLDFDVYLWHCRTGHPSEKNTKHIIFRKAHVTGVNSNGKSPHKFWLSCLLRKKPQSPYKNLTHYTIKPPELPHIDMCSSMPMKMLQKQEHFIAILDNCTMYNNTEPIIRKNECMKVFKETQVL